MKIQQKITNNRASGNSDASYTKTYMKRNLEQKVHMRLNNYLASTKFFIHSKHFKLYNAHLCIFLIIKKEMTTSSHFLAFFDNVF